jgi:hypothetical protein
MLRKRCKLSKQDKRDRGKFGWVKERDVMKATFITLLFVLGVLESYALETRSLEFVAPDYFMKNIVAAEDRTAFEAFYQNFISQVKLMTNEQKAKVLQEIRDSACNNLAIKYPQWSQELKPYNYFERSDKKMLNAQQCVQVRSFLTRYGLYEKFLKEKAQQQASFWCKIKSYTKDVGQQLAQLEKLLVLDI